MSEKKEQKYNSRSEELDEFWDISSLAITPKKTLPASRQSSFDVSTTELSFTPAGKQEGSHTTVSQEAQGMQADANFPIRKERIVSSQNTSTVKVLTAQPQPIQQESVTYKPDHPLLEQVTLHPWRNHFPYYERFCRTAGELFSAKGQPCSAVPFFSYMPQYDQMNRAQMSWYLYWRDLVRKGEYPKTDHSYIFLLIFEIINLPDKIPHERALTLLCNIWLAYREEYPLLDRYVSEWICDFCLLYQLPLPAAQLGTHIRTLGEHCQLREFFVSNAHEGKTPDVSVYLSCCSNYDYKKSRVYASGADAAAAFDRHIPGALAYTLAALSPNDTLFSQLKMQDSSLTRDTFVGALCSHRVKYKIEVRYRSFSRSHELRFFITDIVKYAENKLRSILGFKSKLSIYALSEPVKAILNEYFAEAFPKNSLKNDRVQHRPDYEKLYDLPDTPMSSEQAARIEAASWQTTQQLIDAFGGEQEEVIPPVLPKNQLEAPIISAEQKHEDEQLRFSDKASSPATDDTSTGDGVSFPAEFLPFLRAALRADKQAELDYCRTVSKMPETVVDAINEYAVDTFGDILLEENESGAFVIIEDYRELIPENL